VEVFSRLSGVDRVDRNTKVTVALQGFYETEEEVVARPGALHLIADLNIAGLTLGSGLVIH